MKARAEKRKELSQTIESLAGSMRAEKGCRYCDIYRSLENENELCIIEEWDTRENFDSHLRSKSFRVLRGAITLLQKRHEILVYSVAGGERRHTIRHAATKHKVFGDREFSKNPI